MHGRLYVGLDLFASRARYCGAAMLVKVQQEGRNGAQGDDAKSNVPWYSLILVVTAKGRLEANLSWTKEKIVFDFFFFFYFNYLMSNNFEGTFF